MTPPVRIGITGPIGCGKSTVARWLGERPGVVVIDADRVAREAIEAFMRDSAATLLVVSHDRRLLETVCDRLWVVGVSKSTAHLKR